MTAALTGLAYATPFGTRNDTLTGRQRAAVAPNDRRAELDGFLAGVERRAWSMARFATGQHPDALDIVQEAMLQLVRRYADRPAAEWAPLFHTILQSRIRDWHRRSKVRNRLRVWLGRADAEDAPDPINELPDPAARDPQTASELRWSMETVEAALTRLPARQREAFLCRAWEGLDTAATARAMGCSQGSVKTHYSRAVHALRAALEGESS
ncbi:MAG: RNA polymerase sigma factor [Pseudomonadota bacterium]